MDSFNFFIPTRLIFGVGRLRELTDRIPHHVEKILVVIDPVMVQATGAMNILKELLGDRDLSYFDQVEENPSFETVISGGILAKDRCSQMVIAMGGGSVMDAAKGMAIQAAEAVSFKEIVTGGIPLTADPLPVICIPTTSGTGSEATPYGVYTDKKNRNKCGYGNDKIFPLCSIVDPALTYTMPEKLIVDTGLDVLTHAMEAYLSTITFPLNDQLALHAIETVLACLPDAVKKEKEAMNTMSEAATIGGIVITHGGTILPHIMGYPLTVYHQVPHGRACAVLMPRFLEFLKGKNAVPEKLEILDEMFSMVGGMDNFLSSLGVSTDLKDYGVTADQIPIFVQKTVVKDDIHITPAPVTEQDIADIYGV